MSLHPQASRYLATISTDLPDFLAQQKAEGKADQVPIVSDEVGQMLQMLCSLNKPNQILELGSGIGYSTHWMLLGYPQAKITSVDANQQRLDAAANYLASSGGIDQVKLVCQWAENYLEQPVESFDLIFLDSTKKDYPMLLEQCYKSLRPNGLLVADNIFYQGKLLLSATELSVKEQQNIAKMDQFNHHAAGHPGLDVQFFALGDGLLIARKVA